jgi:23S rRNA pseudouridine1911/1915/1917 synthase
MLHAAELGFVHPESGDNLRFESPLPADIKRLLDRLRSLRGKAARG